MCLYVYVCGLLYCYRKSSSTAAIKACHSYAMTCQDHIDISYACVHTVSITVSYTAADFTAAFGTNTTADCLKIMEMNEETLHSWRWH